MFTPSCATANCHSGVNPPANLNLEAANSYAMLVSVASDQDPNTLRVNPGNPDASYLIQKLEGNAGQQMPPNNALPQADINVIRQWILDGAIDDTAQASDPIRVASLSPAPGADLSAQPNQIVAGFDRDLDASTVNDLTFELWASGGDGAFGQANDAQVMVGAMAISVPGGNQASAIMDLSGVMLADETYQVRLLGDGANVIMDLDANALDGEYSGVFPSGNSAAGGDFLVTFTITTPVMIGPTLDQIQAVVFTPRCAGCHSPGGAAAGTGLFLTDADTSHMTLVNVTSTSEAPKVRVVQFDANASYLVEKIEARQMVGQRMPPPPASALDPAEITAIRDWIDAGAAR